MSTTTESIALPKFLVTTLEPKQQDGDKVVFNYLSEQNEKSELPLFLVEVKYEDKASVAAEWKHDGQEGKGKKFVDAGKGNFSGTAVNQARGSEFTVALTTPTAIALALAQL